MRKNPIPIWIIAGLLFCVIQSCNPEKEMLISGETMGTTYHIKYIAGYFTSPADLRDSIEKRLKEINQSMSTYIKDSEISRFNAIRDTEKKMSISTDFYAVLVQAEKLYRLSEGAWDGTLEPIINLWGFGRSGRRTDTSKLPTSVEIEAQLATIGFSQIEILGDGTIRKKKPAISIDLNSIAKGYAVDQISSLLGEKGIHNCLVEIGGETMANGFRVDKKDWRVGINLPRTDAAYDSVYKIIQLHNKAMATSGDYRNFFELDGVRYSHVFDPRTGYPLTNGVVSVSVLADNCTFADGLATALMVLGPDEGIPLVDTLENVECLMVIEQPDHRLTDYYSKGFHEFE